MGTHNLCFEQIYEKKSDFFLSENSPFLVVQFSIYLNRRVSVMHYILLRTRIMCIISATPLYILRKHYENNTHNKIV